MSDACRRRETCQLCGGRDLERVLSLTATPPANAFVGAADVGAAQPAYPLEVALCGSCRHVQLLDIVDPSVLFENYVYVSGTSPAFVQHFEDYAAEVTSRFSPAAGGLVVDIGSNDGTLLSAFQSRGHRVLGIDPARDIAAAATARGIETRAAFFTDELAADLAAEHGNAAVITANNVFAHAEDLAGITDGVRRLLAADGVFVFEVSYLVDVYESTLFDTIYHEHLAYHSVTPLAAFFARHDLRLFAAERVASHGGSLRGYVCHQSAEWPDDGSVAALISLEHGLSLHEAATLRAFSAKIDGIGAELGGRLRDLKASGKSVAAFGAPAKATTLMYHFGIGPETIDFIVDDSPLKQGLFSPGMHIPVLPVTEMYARRPDAVVVLAWNFAAPIIANHQAYLDAGGQFIVPLPEVSAHAAE
ncbi:MAG: class I SAM-dependent methyltransferase [Magnetovibrio sp.]|nr:class I SAM-dependent methyltransferase [Magnetovibrio sp.]